MSIPRRTLLQAGALSALGLGPVAHAATEAPRTFQPGPSPWRTFELSTEVQVLDAQGLTRVWLPMPDLETDYQRNLGHQWTGNARQVRWVADAREGVRMLYAEFAADQPRPQLRVTSRFQTRNRHTNWAQGGAAKEESATLLNTCGPPSSCPPMASSARPRCAPPKEHAPTSKKCGPCTTG